MAETKKTATTAAPAPTKAKADAPKADEPKAEAKAETKPAAKPASAVKPKAAEPKKAKTTAKKAAAPKKKKAAPKKVKKATAKKAAAKKTAPKKATGQTTVKTKTTAAQKPVGGDIQTMEQIMTTTQEQIEKATKGAFVQFDQIADLQKKQYDAMVKSSTIFVKGVEALSQNFADFTKTAMEKGAANSKTLLGCKTLNELAEAQSSFAQESFEDLVSQATRLSELSAKITSDAFEPLNDQINETMKTLGTKLAA